MNDELHPIDARTFDRLVDGSLSADERRRLLRALDGQPDGWRQCALAFLEAQALAVDLKCLTQPVVASPAAPAVLPTYHRNQVLGIHWLAIAAGLLLAFGVGTLWRGNRDEPTLAGIAPPTSEPSVKAVTQSPTTQLPPSNPSRDALVFFVHDDKGEPQRVSVPLVDAGAIDRQLGVRFRSGVPDTMRDELQQNGYSVHSKRRYAPLWLENGGSLVVPVEDTHIVPISPPVY